MPLQLTINVSGLSSAQMAAAAAAMGDGAKLNDRVAVDAEKFVKKRGRITAATEHKTAESLGARPTGHLLNAYEAIQHVSDATSATLLVPRASRLRAAFGKYVCTPKPPRKFLTIPTAAAAYGHRAREFSDLKFIRSKLGRLFLVRKDAQGNIEPMYLLVQRAEIPEDPALIPFEDLFANARDSAEAYYDEALKAALS